MKEFTKNEVKLLMQECTLIEQFFCEIRKGVAESKFVFEIKKDIPDFYTKEELIFLTSMVGFWVMAYPADLINLGFRECLINSQWAQCKKVETTIYEWLNHD